MKISLITGVTRQDGSFLAEFLINKNYINGKSIIKVVKKYFRLTEFEALLGNANKAKQKLNWVPKISFEQLVKEMTEEDYKSAKNEV
tara:strand:- start:228 stop:488 length:261 start_codon:yes stop_codon:yes gene_type:complete